MKWNMKWNRKKVIPLLLCVYILLTISAYFVLPERLASETNRPANAAVSAPLELPEELKARLNADAAAHADSQDAPDIEDAEIDESEIDASENNEPEDENSIPENDINSAKTDAPKDNTDTSADETQKPAEAHIVTKNTDASVNVRASASSHAKITAMLHNGDTVMILSISGKWYEIQKDDITGFVHRDYIKED